MKRRRLTKQFILDAARYVKAGVPLDVVARLLLPVKEADSFFLWLAVGSDPTVEPQLLRRKLYKDFAAAIDRASAECEARHALIVQKGGSKWSAWWLSRRHPSRWGDRATLVVETPTGDTRTLASRLKALRASTPDPRALPEHVEEVEAVYSTIDERTTVVTAPPLTDGYLDVTPPV